MLQFASASRSSGAFSLLDDIWKPVSFCIHWRFSTQCCLYLFIVSRIPINLNSFLISSLHNLYTLIVYGKYKAQNCTLHFWHWNFVVTCFFLTEPPEAWSWIC
jgi:hypothetical protein